MLCRRATHGEQHDLDVPDETPFVDVIQIVLDATPHFLDSVGLTTSGCSSLPESRSS